MSAPNFLRDDVSADGVAQIIDNLVGRNEVIRQTF
jgi:hypothetical protein